MWPEFAPVCVCVCVWTQRFAWANVQLVRGPGAEQKKSVRVPRLHLPIGNHRNCDVHFAPQRSPRMLTQLVAKAPEGVRWTNHVGVDSLVGGGGGCTFSWRDAADPSASVTVGKAPTDETRPSGAALSSGAPPLAGSNTPRSRSWTTPASPRGARRGAGSRRTTRGIVRRASIWGGGRGARTGAGWGLGFNNERWPWGGLGRLRGHASRAEL